MRLRDKDIRVRPGRIGNRGRSRSTASFVGQALRAAKKAGHAGYRFGSGRRRGPGAVRGAVMPALPLPSPPCRGAGAGLDTAWRRQAPAPADRPVRPLARGAGELERCDLARPLARDRAALGTAGFGCEVRAALERRVDYLEGAGLARRSGQRVVFARDLLATLRTRELEAAAKRLEHETGLASRRPAPGETVAGVYRQRLDLASRRSAMMDDGRGFALVPWAPVLERHLGVAVTGTVKDGGGIDWSLAGKRGLAI